MTASSLPSAADWGHSTITASADELVVAVAAATEDAIVAYKALPEGPERCNDAPTYSRASVEICLPALLADHLMNGHTGYRAHYAAGTEIGEAFNRALVDAVAPLIIAAEDRYQSRFTVDFCRRSLLGKFSKFWYPKELTDPSSHALLALKSTIRHSRWVTYWRARPKPHKGLLAPVASSFSVLLNGTFVSDDGSVYEQKPGRSQQLFESGWT